MLCELVICPLLLSEVARALAYPKLRSRVSEEEAEDLVELLRRAATVAPDPVAPVRRSRDPDDDYLLALAEKNAAVLVTGDRDLLVLSGAPVRSPRAFADELANRR